jgi:hypothetical protein
MAHPYFNRLKRRLKHLARANDLIRRTRDPEIGNLYSNKAFRSSVEHKLASKIIMVGGKAEN